MSEVDHQNDKDEIVSALVRLQIQHEALSVSHDEVLTKMRQAERRVNELTDRESELLAQVDKLLSNLGVHQETIVDYHKHFERLSNYVKEMPAAVQEDAEAVLAPILEFLKVADINERKRELRLQNTTTEDSK
jgi:chromosome segregation ATPase